MPLTKTKIGWSHACVKIDLIGGKVQSSVNGEKIQEVNMLLLSGKMHKTYINELIQFNEEFSGKNPIFTIKLGNFLLYLQNQNFSIYGKGYKNVEFSKLSKWAGGSEKCYLLQKYLVQNCLNIDLKATYGQALCQFSSLIFSLKMNKTDTSTIKPPNPSTIQSVRLCQSVSETSVSPSISQTFSINETLLVRQADLNSEPVRH